MKTKQALIGDINALLGQVRDRFDDDGDADAERDYLVQRCPRRLAVTVRALPTLSLHLLAELADGPAGVVTLAARSGRLKGTVSKHVHRLVEAGLVVRTPVPGNRKEIELTLSKDGELVVRAHAAMHDEMAAGLGDFLARYGAADLAVLATVLRDLAAASKVGVRLSPAAGPPPR